jgi:hypothetical protein
VNRLIRLYPRGWRDRYGDELDALVTDLLADGRGRLPLALDLVRGAIEARRFAMRRFLSDAALRRGLYDGLLIGALVTVAVVLTNVVFPPGPAESDSDPEYQWQLLATVTLLGLLLVAIGFRGARRSGTAWGGLRAGPPNVPGGGPSPPATTPGLSTVDSAGSRTTCRRRGIHRPR